MLPAEPSADAALPRAGGWKRIVLRVIVSAVLTVGSLLLIAWLTLYWGILPHAAEWKPQIEARASQALKTPVRIGTIEVTSTRWMPVLTLRDVVLQDAQGREALRLPRVVAALSPRSLPALEPRFRQLLIDGPTLDVRRDAQGLLFVGGLALGGPGDGDRGSADWFFRQPEFVVRQGSVRWIDERRALPPLVLAEVDLVVRNGFASHDLRLDATPPAEWGDRFSLRGRFRQPLLAPAGEWQRWSGQLHADLPRADVAELQRRIELPFELSSGHGALRTWADVVDGQVRGITADVALRDVTLRLTPALEPLALAEAQGRLVGTRDAKGESLAAQRFGFVTADGLSWPAGDFRLAWRRRGEGAAAGPVDGGELSADQLDLAAAARLADRLPLSAGVREQLAQAQPEGRVENLLARWDGPPDLPSRYQAKGRVSGAAFAAGEVPPGTEPGRPGARGLQIDFDANEQGGQAQVAIAQGMLVFPGLFEAADVPVDRLQASVRWELAQGRLAAVHVEQAEFANAEAQTRFDVDWQPGAPRGADGHTGPGVLALRGTLGPAPATAVARYLPRELPASTRRYVERAVLGGRLAEADYEVQGDLRDFPFARPGQTGQFRVDGRVENVRLAYVPPEAGATDGAAGWPVFEQVTGGLVFERGGMAIRDARARLWGLQLGGVNGGIADLDKAVLALQGQVRGPLADLLRYTDESPVGGLIGGALQQATGSGTAELGLDLSIPLADAERTTVKGNLVLAYNDLRLRPDVPLLASARGRIDFTEKGLNLSGTSARVLDGETLIDGGSQPDGSLRFNAQGTATAEALRRATELGFPSRLAAAAKGQAPYRLSLGFAKGATEFTLSSPLTGMAFDLPAPLAKPADAAWPLQVEVMREARADSGAPLREQVQVSLGSVLQARYLRDVSGATPVVLRGAIGLPEAPPLPATGVLASAVLDRLDTDAWQAALQQLTLAAGAAPPGPASGTAPGAAATASGAPSSEADGYLPTYVALRVGELTTGGRQLSQVVGGATYTPADATWRANLDTVQLSGYVELRPGRGPASPGRVYARLARLSLPPSDETGSVDKLLDQAPSSVPELDVVIDDFELSGRKLGRIEVDAANRGTAEQRLWQLNRLIVTQPEARLNATGQWSGPVGGTPRMQLDFALELQDSGAFATRFGLPGVLRGGKGRMQGQLGWAGSPLSLPLDSLSGEFNVALDEGQFLKAGPGAGRLLSVLSLQSLPRRLLLDFRDLFEEGFAFDNVTGDVRIDDGVAATNNLRMRGVQAAVLMEGQSDLDRETQSLRVIVVPEINAGTASLAYAVINPAIGLGSFVAQLFLRKPLIEAATREFRITGTWDDPKVDSVPHKATGGEPAPPAASASQPQRNP